ncbi:hypothetical protein F4804DRAFT_88915 [Jackrogersella minutella]|nr:hypothetical protein F4804DRAFT_88915 [Jackrogersella minutella]
MCWAYTLIYSCHDCMAEGRPATESSIQVNPDAEDPVVGGYNHEGFFCPLRNVGSSPDGQPITPSGCPDLHIALFPPELFTVSTANEAPRGVLSIDRDRNSRMPSPLQYRFWICPDHRPKYVALGPTYSGYELARRVERTEAMKKDAARGVGGREKTNAWKGAFEGLGSRPQERKRKRKHEGTDTTAVIHSRSSEASQEYASVRKSGERRTRHARQLGSPLSGMRHLVSKRVDKVE